MIARTVGTPRQELVGPVTGTVYRQARKRGLIERQPTEHEQLWLDAVLDVQARLADLLPLTPRSYGYRIAGAPGFTKRSATAGIGEFLSLARRAGWIGWETVDDSRTRTIAVASDASPAALDRRLVRIARGWERWRRLGQRWAPEIWVEAVGSMASVADPAAEFGAVIVSSGGTNSLTEIGRLATRAARRWKGDLRMRTIVLLIGDHDRKGRERFDRAIADAWALLEDVHGIWVDPREVLEFEWVAVTPEQISGWDLAASDDRSDLPAAERSYEVEAIDPADLRDHLRAVLTSYTSTRLLQRVVAASQREAAVRVRRLQALGGPA